MPIRRHTHVASKLSSLIFPLGIVWLLFSDEVSFWPGILLVIAASSMVEDLLEGQWVDALVSVFIFGGLFAWFNGSIPAPGEIILPLGLIGVGLILLLNIFRRNERQKDKRKNKREFEPELDDMLTSEMMVSDPLLDADNDDVLDLDNLYSEKAKRHPIDN